MSNLKPRTKYIIAFFVLLAAEVFIALFIKDSFVRPYVGDILVVLVLYCLCKAVYPAASRLLPLWVTLFAVCVEVLQYFDLVTRLGLSDIAFFRVLLGSVFDPADVLCYAIGGALLFLLEWLIRRKAKAV